MAAAGGGTCRAKNANDEHAATSDNPRASRDRTCVVMGEFLSVREEAGGGIECPTVYAVRVPASTAGTALCDRRITADHDGHSSSVSCRSRAQAGVP